jgi:tetratricopeptide (TPR) repeat protein
MKRLPPLLVAASIAFTAVAARADDVLTYTDKSGKPSTITGKIEQEGPGGVRIRDKSAAVDVPALQIVSIVYDQKKKNTGDFRPPFSRLESAVLGKLRGKELADGLNKTQDELKLLKPVFSDDPKIGRHIAYCLCEIALLKSRDDPKQRGDAVAALKAFAAEHPSKNWQIVPTLSSLAKLQEDMGDADGAMKTYQQLAVLPDVPRELKAVSDLLVGQSLMRQGKYEDAERKWKALADATPPNDPQRAAFTVMLVQSRLEQNKLDGAEVELKKALAGAGDEPRTRAMAHNALGDYYLKKNDAEEAFWQYLRVDVLYSQDPAEHARALYHLGKLFDTVKNNPVRAQQCKDKLKEDAYKGTEYAKKAEEGK